MKRWSRPVLYLASSGPSSLVMVSVMRYDPRDRGGRVKDFWNQDMVFGGGVVEQVAGGQQLQVGSLGWSFWVEKSLPLRSSKG